MDWKIQKYQFNNNTRKLTKENWAKINKTLLHKKNSKIWTNTSNGKRITDDFKNLYQHNNSGKEWDIYKKSEIIKNIINTIKNSENYYSKEDKLYTPFSKAMDYNGFSQSTIIRNNKRR